MMRRLTLFPLLATLLLAASPAQAARQPLVLTPQPGSETEQIARGLVADDLAQAAAKGEAPLVLVASVRLGAANQPPVLFIQLQSARECGSAGCTTSAYRRQGARWQLILDSIGGPIAVDSTRHHGLRDLIVESTQRWIFDGTAYRDPRDKPKAWQKTR